VFFVHNRVQGIHQVAARLQKLVPEASFVVGHGQMDEGELARVMLDFAAGRYDVLVCTTIIESGLDIPNVNTIIINRADRFGLAQLYQLRGRVGRSANRAYAYLLYSQHQQLTPVAQRRLEALLEASDLGAGFQIAMRDLEIRGAGEMLGPEQHGHIVAVGFDLYCKMVDDAVRALQGETVREEHDEVVLDLHVTAYIPDSYIGDATTKLAMYRRIADVGDADGEEAALEELTDRFGRPPREVRTLLAVSRIKSCAEALDIVKVTRQRRRAVLQFHKRCKMPPQTLLLEREGSPLAELLEVLELMRRQRTEKQ
jgi:transcription-repair coupling factor (superfamily II helicase)